MSQSSFYSEFRREAQAAVKAVLPSLLHSAIQSALSPFRTEVARLTRENDALRKELAQVQENSTALTGGVLEPRPVPEEAELRERRRWATITKTVLMRNGWSQRKLGDYLGTTNQPISMWSRMLCKPSPHYQEMLLSLLDEANDSELLRNILLEGEVDEPPKAVAPQTPRKKVKRKTQAPKTQDLMGLFPKGLVQKVMKRRGFSGKDLAEKLGVAQSTVSRWARGVSMPQAHHIEQLRELQH